jgi:hypothetical protein
LTWTAFATVTITFTVMATALTIFTVIRRKSPKELQGALRDAEAEFEAATKRSGVNAAARRPRRATAALRAARRRWPPRLLLVAGQPAGSQGRTPPEPLTR